MDKEKENMVATHWGLTKSGKIVFFIDKNLSTQQREYISKIQWKISVEKVKKKLTELILDRK